MSSTKKRILIGAIIAVSAACVVALVQRGGASDDDPAHVHRVDGRRIVVDELVASPSHVVIGGDVSLTARVMRGSVRSGALTLQWRGAGAFSERAAVRTTWRAPALPGRYELNLSAKDGDGAASASVMVSVRLPSARRKNGVAAAYKRARPSSSQRAAKAEARIAALRAQLSQQPSTVNDYLRAQLKREELGRLLKKLHLYEEALTVYKELRGGVGHMNAKYKRYSNELGQLHFFLGNDVDAKAALLAAGEYCFGKSRYYLADLLERGGDVDGAAIAYARAAKNSPRFADPVFRLALIRYDSGADAAALSKLLVDASPKADGPRMLERLRADTELEPLLRALDSTDSTGALRPAEVIHVAAPAPPARDFAGRPPVVTVTPVAQAE